MSIIRYVHFNTPVQLGRIGSIAGWSADKHGARSDVEEKGAFLYLFEVERTTIVERRGEEDVPVTVTRRVRRVRVPMTNVAYIDDDPVVLDDKRSKA